MPIELGTLNVEKAYLGSTELTQMYLGSDELLVAPVGPQLTLDWQFAAQESLTDVVNNQTLTFTRASIGTFYDNLGVLQQAANGVARFDNAPNSGGALGLLIEEQRTNLSLNSEAFDLKSSSGAPVVTPDTTVAPDGNTTADTIQNPGAVDGKRDQVIGGTPGTRYTATVYVRNIDSTRVRLRIQISAGNSDAAYDFASSTPGADIVSATPGTIGNSEVSFENAGNGWWRIRHSIDIDTSGTVNYTYISGNGGGTSAVWWGSQIEEAGFATSYIPTTGASATRSRDECQALSGITGIFSPGSFFVDYFTNRPPGGTKYGVFSYGDASISSERIDIQSASADDRSIYEAYAGDARQANLVADAGSGRSAWKVSGRWNQDDFAGSFSDVNLATDVSGTIPGAMQAVIVGANLTGARARAPTVHVKQLSAYDGPLDDAALQALTT